MMLLLIGFGAIALVAIIPPLLDRPRDTRRHEDPVERRAERGAGPGTSSGHISLEEREAAALAELRDLELDYRLGKLSEDDYHELRGQLARRAVATLKVADERHQAEAARARELDDLIEREVLTRRAVRRQLAVAGRRECPSCGRVASADDRFCARCGAALPQSPIADGVSLIAGPEQREATRDTQQAIRNTRPVSKWLLIAGIAAAVWAVVVGVIYFRARAAIESQRPIATLTAADYRALAILPADPNFVFFGHQGGLMWSGDGGANWQHSSVTSNVLALAVHPADPLRVYLAGRDVFLRSGDGGRNWQAVAADLPGPNIQALTVSPDDPETLYAFIAGQGLWRSQNDGVNWTPVAPTLSENVTALAVTPGTIYVGTDGLGVLASRNGGATWASANSIVNGALDGPRVRALVYDPATGTLYAGTDRGLSFTTNVGSGWTRRPFRGDVAALALGPDGTTMVLVASNGQVFRSGDRGVTWRNQ